MHEYMKKALIAALLVVSASFAPCLRNVADFPGRTSELARAAASPLFWQVWDELLSRELAQWTKTFPEDDRQPERLPEFSKALTCLFSEVFLKLFQESLFVDGNTKGFSYRLATASFVVL